MTRASVCRHDPCPQSTSISQGDRHPSNNEQTRNCDYAKCLRGKVHLGVGAQKRGICPRKEGQGSFPEDVAEELRSEEPRGAG